MRGQRLTGAALVCLLIGARVITPVEVRAAVGEAAPLPSENAPLFRVFLKDGTSLVSYGEFARVNDRVVFSMPTSASPDEPQLNLVDISASRVDWARTVDYAESARAARYLATRAETDFATLTATVAQALNDVALTTDPVRRLAIVERARKVLSDWPSRHYGYKQEEVRQTVSLLDEAIADLRAATGAQRFDLSLVAVVESPKLVEPLLPPPTAKEAIEQTVIAARLTESPAQRTSLLAVAAASIDRESASLPSEWATATRRSLNTAIARELQADRAYQALSVKTNALAQQRAAAADVRGLQKLVDEVKSRDQALGASRPDVVASIVGLIEDQLDAARRLQLVRDRWAMRLPELRSYRQSIGDSLQRLMRLGPALEDIKALAGSRPEAIAAILDVTARVLRLATSVQPPDELREAHSLMVSAAQLAENAARVRREAALTGDMTRAWNASSSAAGALMLSARALTEMQNALRVPQLVR